MTLPGELPKRRSTHEAVHNLTQAARNTVSPNAPWYTLGVDFCFYAPAQEACARSRERLRKLKLQDDELALLEASVEPDKIAEKLRFIVAEQEMKSKLRTPVKRTGEFVNTFCAFADKTSNIVMTLIPQSMEYTATFGMLFLLFNAVVTKKDREESLLSYIQSLNTQLPVIDFYKTVFPTNKIKAAVAQLYVHIMQLLDEAIIYYRSWRLSKLVDAFFQPNNKFDIYISNVEAEMKTIHTLKDAGHIAQASDMHSLVSETGVVVARLYQNFESQSSAIGSSMAMINDKLDRLTTFSSQILHFEMIKHARELQDELLPSGHDADDDLEILLSRPFHLSQKDHWEFNGILNDLLTWSKHGRDTLLWIGGSSGNQDSWVTELSTDLIQALQPQPVTVLFVFCDQQERFTPLGLIRRLFVQLLNTYPDLAYQYPQSCNLSRFKKAVTFRQTWRIFEQIASKVPDLFIIVDRVEQCEIDEQADLKHQLLPALIALGEGHPTASVIVTSTFDPPDEVADMPILATYIDTSKRAGKR